MENNINDVREVRPSTKLEKYVIEPVFYTIDFTLKLVICGGIIAFIVASFLT